MDKYEVLKKYFGYDGFRQGQEKIIDAILSGHDALGVMPTGAGKSVCFQVPALLLRGVTIVISPLISLMKDQVTALKSCGIPSVFINTAMSGAQISEAVREILKGRVKLVYVAPERLMTDFFLSVCSKIDISIVAVDEAHCVSQWGQDFRPSYLEIKDFILKLKKRPVVCAFTATATPKVRQDIQRLLCLDSPETVVTSFDRKNLYFEVVKPRDKRVALKRYLELYTGKSGIIYCSSRRCVDEVFEFLNENNYPVVKYHAGMQKSQRTVSQELFCIDRKELIVATNAFGMGIDKPNVSFVIHYNMPGDLESYYQEAGRAGRDGKNADCILFFDSSDVRIQHYFINNPEDNPNLSEADKQKLKFLRKRKLSQMVGYCQSESCLRQYILSYFGERSQRCDNCSVCTGELKSSDVTLPAQKIFCCIKRLKENEDAITVRNVFKGKLTPEIEQKELFKIKTFGAMNDCAESVIDSHIAYFTARDFIRIRKDGALFLSDKCADVIKGEKSVRKIIDKKKSDTKTAFDPMLYAKLKKLRRECARKASVPDFIIFSDVTLTAMASSKPLSIEQMALLPGINHHKLKRYGIIFLKEINRHCKENLEKEE